MMCRKTYFMTRTSVALLCLALARTHIVQGFVPAQNHAVRVSTTVKNTVDDASDGDDFECSLIRRSLFHSAAATSLSLALGGSNLPVANAAVGNLPEFSDSDAIIQGLTVNVADRSQLDSMVDFLLNGFDFQILRQRIRDSVEEVVSPSFFDWITFHPCPS